MSQLGGLAIFISNKKKTNAWENINTKESLQYYPLLWYSNHGLQLVYTGDRGSFPTQFTRIHLASEWTRVNPCLEENWVVSADGTLTYIVSIIDFILLFTTNTSSKMKLKKCLSTQLSVFSCLPSIYDGELRQEQQLFTAACKDKIYKDKKLPEIPRSIFHIFQFWQFRNKPSKLRFKMIATKTWYLQWST